MDLAQLIESRQRAGAGSLREMERRARAVDPDNPISRTMLSDYANNRVAALPGAKTRQALANALDVSFEVVTAAAMTSVAPELTDADLHDLHRAQAFLKLTEGRTDQEVEHLLGVVRAALTAIDASRRQHQ